MATRAERSALVRRAFHLASPAWLIWYWMPPDSWVGVRKEAVLVSFVAIALSIEAARLLTGRPFPGLRDNEADRMSAYAWGALGLALGLLFFPAQVVIVTFWGMAWVDPLCAYTRKNGGYPWIPFVAYAVLGVLLSLVLVPRALYQTASIDWAQVAIVVPIAAFLALAAERPNVKAVDDDFLMNVVPMIGMSAVLAVL